MDINAIVLDILQKISLHLVLLCFIMKWNEETEMILVNEDHKGDFLSDDQCNF